MILVAALLLLAKLPVGEPSSAPPAPPPPPPVKEVKPVRSEPLRVSSQVQSVCVQSIRNPQVAVPPCSLNIPFRRNVSSPRPTVEPTATE